MSFVTTECRVEILRWSGGSDGGHTIRITDTRSDTIVADITLTHEQFGRAVGSNVVAEGRVTDDGQTGRYLQRYIIKTDAMRDDEADAVLESSALALAGRLRASREEPYRNVSVSSIHRHNNGSSILVDYTVTEKPERVVVAHLTPEQARKAQP